MGPPVMGRPAEALQDMRRLVIPWRRTGLVAIVSLYAFVDESGIHSGSRLCIGWVLGVRASGNCSQQLGNMLSVASPTPLDFTRVFLAKVGRIAVGQARSRLFS
jgi:hypothetical protein